MGVWVDVGNVRRTTFGLDLGLGLWFAGRVRVDRRVRFIYHPRPPREVQANRIPTPPTCPLQYGRTPMIVAADKGHADVIDTLVKHGANVNIADEVAPLATIPPASWP